MSGKYHKDPPYHKDTPPGGGGQVWRYVLGILAFGELRQKVCGKSEDCMHYIMSLNLAWAT